MNAARALELFLHFDIVYFIVVTLLLPSVHPHYFPFFSSLLGYLQFFPAGATFMKQRYLALSVTRDVGKIYQKHNIFYNGPRTPIFFLFNSPSPTG